MVENIPEEFEFMCKWNGNTIKLSEIVHIAIDPDGGLWAYAYREKALISIIENNTNMKLTFTRSCEEFGKLLFAVYSTSVLK